MTDEEYVFRKDSIEKKRSARGYYQKNKTGKGRVRFPDDNLTRKEKAALSKDLGTYKLGEPVYWKEFRTWPAQYQKEYFERIYQLYNVGSKPIGAMMRCNATTIDKLRNKLGIQRNRNDRPTDEQLEAFRVWVRTFRGYDESEYPYETVRVKEPDEDYESQRPSQIEKFEKRYATTNIVKPMSLTFRVSNIGENLGGTAQKMKELFELFRNCPEVEIEIRTPRKD